VSMEAAVEAKQGKRRRLTGVDRRQRQRGQKAQGEMLL
jgi:hypothetical protein